MPIDSLPDTVVGRQGSQTGSYTINCRAIPDGMIVMLIVFHKTRRHDLRQIDRAVRAQQACEREHRRPAEQTYERQA